jgi:putative peptide zinc metalloprotease protein
MTSPASHRGLHVSLHALEFRPDRGEWIVGRQGNEQVIALPEIGMAVVRLLAEGSTVEEARSSLRANTGRDIDVRAFVEQLAAAGLVASIGDRQFAVPPPIVSYPGLRSRHVRWVMSPVVHAFALLVPVCTLLFVASRPRALPSWDELLWTKYGTFTVLVQVVVASCLIALHELAHLVTARAAGVSGRIRLGTRLQFLVAQTEVSGIWLKSRRERLTVYLSGIMVDAFICSICLVLRGLGVHWPVLSVIVMTLVTALANQCLVFMRTDVYFVIQDLTGCRNLYGDAGRYVRYLAARVWGRRPDYPLGSLSKLERRFLKTYTVGTLLGSLVCVFIGLRILTDVSWPLFQRSLVRVVGDADPWTRLDALVTVLLLGGLQGVWVRLWWKRHGSRTLALLHKVRGSLGRG